MKHTKWFTRITRGDSLRKVAEVAQISDRTLSRQLRAGSLDPALIIKIAEAYDESPIVALIDLGFMSSKWFTKYGTVTELSKATDEELTNEMLYRLRLLDRIPVDELAEKRRKTKSRNVQDAKESAESDALDDFLEAQDEDQEYTDADLISFQRLDTKSMAGELFAADGSDTEPEPGDDGHGDGA